MQELVVSLTVAGAIVVRVFSGPLRGEGGKEMKFFD